MARPLFKLEDYGGVAGEDDSSDAMRQLMSAVNARSGHCDILITAGTWNFQRTESFDDTERWFIDCWDIDIWGLGAGTSILKVLANAKLRNTGTPGGLTLYSEGFGWRFERGGNIRIFNMTINGNVENLNITNAAHDGHCFGVEFLGTDNVLVSGCTITAMGTSGLRTSIDADNSWQPKDLVVNNCTFSYCRVNNTEINALNCGIFRGCTWNNANDLVGKGPGAGVDVEPNAPREIFDLEFRDCTFTDNVVEVVRDSTASTTALAQDNQRTGNIRFIGCTMSNTDGSAIWWTDPDTLFDGCTVTGRVVHFAAKAVGCSFYIDDTQNGNYAIDASGDYQMRLVNCTLTSQGSKRLLLARLSTSEGTRKEITNCAFDYQDNDIATNSAIVSVSGVATVSGCTFDHTGPAPDSGKWVIQYASSTVTWDADNSLTDTDHLKLTAV